MCGFPRVVFRDGVDDDFRGADLVNALIDELLDIDPDNPTALAMEALCLMKRQSRYSGVIRALYLALNHVAPPGFYFGQYGHDSKEIGWWPVDDFSRPYLAP